MYVCTEVENTTGVHVLHRREDATNEVLLAECSMFQPTVQQCVA